MATRGNLEAADFLMRQKMTGKKLLGSLPRPMSAYPVTRVPGDDEESFEETATAVQPAPEDDGEVDHGCVYCVAKPDHDYEHTLVLESQYEEEDASPVPADELAADGDMDQQTVFEGPDDDVQPDDVQTVFFAGDDPTVFPEEDELTIDAQSFEDDADDATVCPGDGCQRADDNTTHGDGMSLPIGAFKKRRTG